MVTGLVTGGGFVEFGIGIGLLTRMPGGQGDDECCAFTETALGGDGAAVPLDYFTANGKPDTSTLVLAPPVQPLEHLEDPAEVLLVEADPVVLHGDPAQPRRSVRRAGHPQRLGRVAGRRG